MARWYQKYNEHLYFLCVIIFISSHLLFFHLLLFSRFPLHFFSFFIVFINVFFSSLLWDNDVVLNSIYGYEIFSCTTQKNSAKPFYLYSFFSLIFNVILLLIFTDMFWMPVNSELATQQALEKNMFTILSHQFSNLLPNVSLTNATDLFELIIQTPNSGR